MKHYWQRTKLTCIFRFNLWITPIIDTNSIQKPKSCISCFRKLYSVQYLARAFKPSHGVLEHTPILKVARDQIQLIFQGSQSKGISLHLLKVIFHKYWARKWQPNNLHFKLKPNQTNRCRWSLSLFDNIVRRNFIHAIVVDVPLWHLR